MFDELFKMYLRSIKRRGERQKIKQELKARYARYYPCRRGAKVSNVMLVIIVTMITTYTIANLWITYASGVSIDSTLTTCFYAFWGTELALLAGLKTSKIIKGADIEDAQDNCIEDEEELG